MKPSPHISPLAAAGSIFFAVGSAYADQPVDFAHEVLPILEEHCTECHTGEKKKGGLAMNTREELLAGSENGEVVTPGDHANSLFLILAASEDEDEWMPPKGPRLSAEELAVLRRWVDADLPWDAGVTLGETVWETPLRPRAVELPPAQNGREHPIDRLLDAGLARSGQAVPGRASDAAFLRRATLDATGLLPTVEELEAFLADPAEDKRAALVDRLLADDVAYADHWLTTWNDLLRNDYTGTGFITGGRKQITGWLYTALRDNKPYDQFVRELIAPADAGVSGGFIDGIKWRGDVNSSQTREIQFAQNISQVFLGINMKCASCHDSFIDRWKLEDAYSLAAIYADGPVELNRCDKPTGTMATARWIFPELGEIDAAAAKPERLNQLAALMTHPENGRFARTVVNRLWERLMGRGIVHPVDAMDTAPWDEDLLDYLGVHFAEEGYDLRAFIRFVMTSEAYGAASAPLAEAPGEGYRYAGPLARRMTAEQFLDSIWQITGANPGKAAVNVDRRPRPADPGSAADAAARLVALPVTAKWIWHGGASGEKTQLRRTLALDEAPEVAVLRATCDNAFTLKINGAEVCSSDDWQKPVVLDLAAHLRAGDNVFEVDAEMHGGAYGFVLQLALLTGEEEEVLVTDGAWEARPPGGEWAAAAELHPHSAGPWGQVLEVGVGELSRLPTPPVRAALVANDFLMRSLGRPHRDQVVTTRPAELTTLQAIDLANGDILAGYLSRGAASLAGKGKSAPELVDWLYRTALSRPPTGGELAVLTEVLGDATDPTSVQDALWLIFMQPEFQIVR